MGTGIQTLTSSAQHTLPLIQQHSAPVGAAGEISHLAVGKRSQGGPQAPRFTPRDRPSSGAPSSPLERALTKNTPRPLPGRGAPPVPVRRTDSAMGLVQTASSFRVSIGLPKVAGALPSRETLLERAASAVQALIARQLQTAYLRAFEGAPASLDLVSAGHAAAALVAATEHNLCAVNRSVETLVAGSQMGGLLRLFSNTSLESLPSSARQASGVGEDDPCGSEVTLEDKLAAILAEASGTTGQAPAGLLAAPETAQGLIRKTFGSTERYVALRLGRIRALRRIFGFLENPLIGEVLVPLVVEKALLTARPGEIQSHDLRKYSEEYVQSLSSFSLSLIAEYEKVVARESFEHEP